MLNLPSPTKQTLQVSEFGNIFQLELVLQKHVLTC